MLVNWKICADIAYISADIVCLVVEIGCGLPDKLGNAEHLRRTEAAGGDSGRADAHARGDERTFRVVRDGILVGSDVHLVQTALQLLAGHAGLSQVDEHQVVVRAAADQLETWGARVNVPVVRSDKDGADPASVAFEASAKAKEANADVLIIDTAGRLQNKSNLMDELGKIRRVTEKNLPVDEVLLVLDATTGQNGMAQAKVFAEAIGITGVVLSKLDGSAKGGIVISVQKELGVPVKLVGLGEGPDDLAPFDPEGFVDGILA